MTVRDTRWRNLKDNRSTAFSLTPWSLLRGLFSAVLGPVHEMTEHRFCPISPVVYLEACCFSVSCEFTSEMTPACALFGWQIYLKCGDCGSRSQQLLSDLLSELEGSVESPGTTWRVPDTSCISFSCSLATLQPSLRYYRSIHKK